MSSCYDNYLFGWSATVFSEIKKSTALTENNLLYSRFIVILSQNVSQHQRKTYTKDKKEYDSGCFLLKWLLRLFFCFALYGHKGQTNFGSLPHSRRLWRVRFSGQEYDRPHWSHVKIRESAIFKQISQLVAL